MKAIRFAQYGEPAQVLAVQERPLPEPGPGEVRVRILASPINPSELLFVRGHYAGVQPQFPAPAGFEGVGRVEALGPQVQRPVPGQRVAVVEPGFVATEIRSHGREEALQQFMRRLAGVELLAAEDIAAVIGQDWSEQQSRRRARGGQL